MKNSKNSYVFVTRMFSGLFESIKDREWKPTGIPAFVKLVEKLSVHHSVTWIISCKTYAESAIVDHRYTRLKLNNVDIHVFPFENRFFKPLKRTKWRDIADHLFLIMTDLKLVLNCIRITKLSKHHIYYFDRADILTAAVVKWLSKAIVVVRILGVYPNQKQMASTCIAKLKNPLIFLSYKTAYDLAIGTQDGSGIEFFMNKLLNSATPARIMLNGVKKFGIIAKNAKHNDKPIIKLLFVGKLIPEKGVLELITALSYLKENYKNFTVEILGKGYLEQRLRTLIDNYNLYDYVKIIGSVGQSEIYRYYQRADVYISLNKLGNLSNTVLEAMSAGKCIILLEKDDQHHTDVFTHHKIPSDVVIRISRNDMAYDLADKLSMICKNPNIVQNYSLKMARFKEQFLWSWEKRINTEINIIEALYKQKLGQV